MLFACLAAGLAFITGWRFVVAGPVFGVLLLLVTTYRNSWGDVLHTENLLVLHVLVLGLVPAADAWSWDASRARSTPRSPSTRYGWPVRLVCLLTVLTYVLAGWAKVRNGGAGWVLGETLRNHVAEDNVRKVLLGDTHSPIGARAVAHGWLFPPLAAMTLVVELGAGRAARWPLADSLGGGGVAVPRRHRRAHVDQLPVPAVRGGVRPVLPGRTASPPGGAQARSARKASTSSRSLVRRMGGSALTRSHR